MLANSNDTASQQENSSLSHIKKIILDNYIAKF